MYRQAVYSITYYFEINIYFASLGKIENSQTEDHKIFSRINQETLQKLNKNNRYKIEVDILN